MTTPENLRLKARGIFMDLLGLTKSDRPSALDAACGQDAALREEVEALLRADDFAGAFMARPELDAAAPQGIPSGIASERPGTSIGHYKLLEQIGEGGMGTIWMAEQREPVKRRVALKIIKLGMDTKQVIARFEAERQALAMMDHPHIAKVFDAGTTEAGRPYFVMEYIKGIPILDYCDQAKLDLPTRLELFINVCNAIQHAHQKGIIHRDIKPSNVLVTLHDGAPVPKVIDFGIAKATNSELTTKTLFTQHRQMIGTPTYMSPEQAELSGLDIDTRSDVYSLGVLLYEMLTSTPPFDIQALLKDGFSEMMRTIREVEPIKPSTRVATLDDTGTRAAKQRRIDSKRLGTLLRGDLDWIVMKCLEKDRTRRYDTANGLAADIKRHLSDEPVVAGPPSARYKLRKFVKRNRSQVIAGGAVATALILGLVGTGWGWRWALNEKAKATLAADSEHRARVEAQDQARKAEEQTALAEASRIEAELQRARAIEQEAEAKKQGAEALAHAAEAEEAAAIAAAVVKFQTDMLGSADPKMLLGESVTVLQALEAAVELLDKGSLSAQPLVEAGVRHAIGTTLNALGRYEDAEENLRIALELHRRSLPAGDVAIGASLNNLAMALQSENELGEAETLFRQALSIAREAPPEGNQVLSKSLNNLASLLNLQYRLTEAEPLFREALEINRATLPPEHEDTARTLNNLATVLHEQNNLVEAESLYREALSIYRGSLPGGHPETSPVLNNLARLCGSQGRVIEAELLHREAVEGDRASLPAGHPNVARSLNGLAQFLISLNRLEEAEPICLEALEIDRAAFPQGHPNIAHGLNNLASLRTHQRKRIAAERLYREALAIQREALPSRHPEVARTLDSLAQLVHDRNNLVEAEPLYREALEIRRSALYAGHPDIAGSLANLAELLHDQNRLAEAEALKREALDTYRAALRPGDPLLATILSNLAGVLLDQQKLSEAEPLIREALEIYRAAFPTGDTGTATMLNNYAEVLRVQGKLVEAERLFIESLELQRRLLPEGHLKLATPLNNLARLLAAQERFEEAEPFMLEALQIVRASLPAGHRVRLMVEENLLDMYLKQGKGDQAVPLIQDLVDSARTALPKGSPEFAAQLARAASTLLDLGRWSELEVVIRECLSIREQTQPDAWTTFNSQSVLGAALLGQGRLAEAEAPLLQGYLGMKEREEKIPPTGLPRISEALERLVRLYEAKKDAEEAAVWQTKLDTARDEYGLSEDE